MDTLMTIINNCGFPIAMTIMLYLEMKNSNKLHKEEIEKLTNAINNNNIVVQQLLDKLDN